MSLVPTKRRRKARNRRLERERAQAREAARLLEREHEAGMFFVSSNFIIQAQAAEASTLDLFEEMLDRCRQDVMAQMGVEMITWRHE